MAIPFAGFAVIGFYGGIPELRRALAARKWPVTEGLIERVSEESHRTKGKGRSLYAIEYKVTYHYVVDGKSHKGRWKSLISTTNKPGMCPFKQGDVVPVYVDPQNAGESRLFKNVRLQDAFLFLGGVAFTIAAALPVWVYFQAH